MLIDPYHFQPARITLIVREAARAVSLRLKTDKPYTFQPGQHAVVRVSLADGTRLIRQYSFSSAPSSNELWMTITQTDGGAMSSWFVRQASEGDTVEISPPYTGPLVQNITRGNLCMIAGGSGIAPLMSWLRHIRTLPHPPHVTLLYSTRTGERCFVDELTPRSHEAIIVRQSDTDGRFTASDLASACENARTVLLCGSRPFVVDMRQLCETANPDARIFSEAFTL